MRIVVTGAGGFIGSHLVEALVREGGAHIVGVDVRRPEYGLSRANEFVLADLRDRDACAHAVAGADLVYALAANMGGIGWTHTAGASIAHDNLLISTNTTEACRSAGVGRLVYTSSACVYPGYLQQRADSPALREDAVFPADPDREYGWEKLMAELLCESYRSSYGTDMRIARLHAIYGPRGCFEGARAKSLSMLCGKVARLDRQGTIEVWGDGTQTRSYCYVDDCVEGLRRLAASDVTEPINIGSAERVSITELVEHIAAVSGKRVNVVYDLDRPVGPRGRCSDNTRCAQLLGWEPRVPLADGLALTYRWIEDQVRAERSDHLVAGGPCG